MAQMEKEVTINRNMSKIWAPGQGVWLPRVHFFEVDDQEWFPQTLREKVQDNLTLGWVNQFPLLQTIAPCALVTKVMLQILGKRISDYVYVDFASGAGGPIPFIEGHLNKQRRETGKEEVQFVLSDIKPHLSAWTALSKKSPNLSFIPQSIDATNAPQQETLLKDVPGAEKKKVMRVFNLAFHHFDDDLAANVLENTFETADGFCIFELQSRHFVSFLTVSLLWLLSMLAAPIYFINSPSHLFFTYVIPIVPFIYTWDGIISCLRTRTPEEVQALLESKVPKSEIDKWTIRSGQDYHLWPIGWLFWIVATKDRK